MCGESVGRKIIGGGCKRRANLSHPPFPPSLLTCSVLDSSPSIVVTSVFISAYMVVPSFDSCSGVTTSWDSVNVWVPLLVVTSDPSTDRVQDTPPLTE